MPHYKKQHYLPVGYLKFFSADSDLVGRNSPIWTVTEKGQNRSIVDNECCVDYHYSKQNPSLAENNFDYLERDCPNVVSNLLAGEPFTADYKFRLFFWTTNLHVRNPSYENRINMENIHSYEKLAHAFMWQAVRGARTYMKYSSNDEPSAETRYADAKAYRSIIEDEWSAKVLYFDKPDLFTSDNPALAFQIGTHEYLDFLILPISPQSLLVYTDNSKCDVKPSELSEKDVLWLNGIQAMRCLEKTYAARKLSEKERVEVIKILLQEEKRQRYRGFVGIHDWKANFLSYPMGKDEFSFIQLLKK